MNILLFIIVLGILVFVHELGHFLFAKLFRIRVEEFGFGYPPRMLTLGYFRGTKLTLNWIPFGGFVKIFGESDDGSELADHDKEVSLVHKPKWQQLLVMFGGILFNIIFAWVLFTGLYTAGVTASINAAPENYTFDETKLVVSTVLTGSPADQAGLLPGDEVKEYFNTVETVTVRDEDITDVATFVNQTGALGERVGIVVLRGTNLEVISALPEEGIVDEGYGIGINLDRVGELQLPIHQALWYGAKTTYHYTTAIIDGFWQLITGRISADNVSGPVGIVKQIGDASRVGLVYLISFTALLSLNLAVLNIIPFPALDGGRIAIILIETVIRRRIKPIVVNWINTIGFLILIALMVLVTVSDVVKLF